MTDQAVKDAKAKRDSAQADLDKAVADTKDEIDKATAAVKDADDKPKPVPVTKPSPVSVAPQSNTAKYLIGAAILLAVLLVARFKFHLF